MPNSIDNPHPIPHDCAKPTNPKKIPKTHGAHRNSSLWRQSNSSDNKLKSPASEFSPEIFRHRSFRAFNLTNRFDKGSTYSTNLSIYSTNLPVYSINSAIYSIIYLETI